MISLRSVTKRYGAAVAVDGLSLEVASGELCVLLGPSGCGKTTTLKMVNRLIEPTSGTILLDGEDIRHVDVVQLRRRIGYVMQHGGLFPHQRVADNIATVPRLLGWTKQAVSARVGELLELVGLDPAVFAKRYPHELSGGERQRVGVARALGGDPPVLLMDEPFGAVDPLTRRRLQREFKDLQARLEKTVILVTHDIDEAAFLGSKIAVLARRGVLQQLGTPAEVVAAPASRFVADFVGSDHGLRRLSVTPARREDLLGAPGAPAGATMKAIVDLIDRSAGDLAVLLEEDGTPSGWLGRDTAVAAAPDAPARTLSRRLAAVVPLGSSLNIALAAILQDDAGIVAVIDKDGYAGLLTLTGLHEAMRRPVVPATPRGVPAQ